MTFLDFAAEHGLLIDNLVEGRWARVKTTDHPKKRNGAYKFLGDVGFVQNHATMEKVAVWQADGKVEKIDRSAMRKRMAQPLNKSASATSRMRASSPRGW
jgi:hypothetical protein